MPPRRRARPAPPDVDALRFALGQGKIVRVGIIPSDQFPEGLTGRVRRIGDPAQDGEEFLFVEVSVGGAKDVLPFAPGDLTGSPPRKQSGPARVGAPNAVTNGSPSGGPGAAGPVALFAATAQAPTSRTPQAVGTTAIPAARPTAPLPAATPIPAAASGPAAGGPPPKPVAGEANPGDVGTDSSTAASAPAGRRAGGPAARGRRPPVTITITTAGDETAAWHVEAMIGAKTAVRPTLVSPSRVWEIVESLGEPKLTTLVRSLLDEHRRSTQTRADQLAAQLAALQTELNSFPAADG